MSNVTVRGTECRVEFHKYANGRVALELIDVDTDERYATATINLPDVALEAGEVAIKDYSENAGVLVALVKAGVVAPPCRNIPSGFVKAPICRLLVPVPA